MHIRTNKQLNVLFRPIIFAAEWLGTHNPKLLMRMRYYARFHKKLNLTNPQTLNEKILFLSLRTDTSLWTTCSDKYLVRQYVEQCGLKNSLVKLYGAWENVSDLDFEKLPDKFVLKGNHGCGDIMLVRDKSSICKDDVIKTYQRDLKKKYGALEAGAHYLRIKPMLIAEELLENDAETALYSSSLIDYKVWCFNGKPYFIWVCKNRSGHHKETMLYDTEWNPYPEYLIYDKGYVQGTPLPKPHNLQEMMNVAKTLSAPFPEVRVDLYNLNGKVYFGELTFTGYGGLMNHYTEEFQKLAGSLIDISKVQVIR